MTESQNCTNFLREDLAFHTTQQHTSMGDQCAGLIEYEPLCMNLAALYVAENGQLTCLQFLLEHGADVNAKDSIGNTLLAKAVAHPSCVEYLMRHGADINITDKDGSSALMKAAAGGYRRSLQLLLHGGPFINGRNKYGFTALIQATRNRRTHCTQLLLEHSADLNMVDKAGYSALIHAAVKQSVACVKLLLGAGVIIDRNIYESMYCLLKSWDTAIVNKQIILMLFAGGADRPKTNHGETSIYWRNLAECIKPYTCQGDFSLKQLCRTTIRNYLWKRHCKRNLFYCISRLRLPHLLHSYLLYQIEYSH